MENFNKHINSYNKDWIMNTSFLGMFFCIEENSYVIIIKYKTPIILPVELNDIIEAKIKYHCEIKNQFLYNWLRENQYHGTAEILRQHLQERYNNHYNLKQI